MWLISIIFLFGYTSWAYFSIMFLQSVLYIERERERERGREREGERERERVG